MKKRMKLIGVIMTMAALGTLTACGSSGTTAEEEGDTAASEESVAVVEDESAAAEGESAATSSDLSGTVAVGGSTSMESVIGYLKEQFTNDNSGVTISYAGVGSGGGIEGASNGTYDIGLSSRDLKEEEADNGLTATTLALDGITVIVNSGNGVEDLSLDDITAIYNGEITNWSEVGGDDLEIALIGREESSGTRDGFESITDTDGSHLDQELTSTGAVITAVGSSDNAIGYASLSAVEGQADIKAVTVDGVACSEETILDGSYAIQRPFVMVTNDSEPLSTEAQAFFDFCISDDAKELIRAAGAVPLE
ncbi:MAG: phosphate ABC transporter substrate-binding protein [Lachnospiraceae bacterium]|nr:phosphate ABC transporter substrate-binding protein [Lachnospiraceae bacterium]